MKNFYESRAMLYRLLFTLLFLQATMAAWALPAGDFQVGESEGDDFHQVLHLEGDQASFRKFSESGQPDANVLTMKVSAIAPDLYQLVGDEQGEHQRAYLRFTSTDEALFWFTGQNQLYWVLRNAKTDTSALQGHWFALAEQDVWEVEFGDDAFVLNRDGEKVRWTLQTVSGSTANEIRTVARPENGEASLLSFIPLGPELWLVRNHDADHYIMLYRESSKAMMDAERELRQNTRSLEDDGEKN